MGHILPAPTGLNIITSTEVLRRAVRELPYDSLGNRQSRITISYAYEIGKEHQT